MIELSCKSFADPQIEFVTREFAGKRKHEICVDTNDRVFVTAAQYIFVYMNLYNIYMNERRASLYKNAIACLVFVMVWLITSKI